MKEIDSLNKISDYLSIKSPYYRKLNAMHKEASPWVKAAHGLAVVSLAVTGACQKIGLVTPSTETAVPNVHETLQPTEIPSTPEITPGIGEVQFLNQDEVLAIPVARTSGGELIPLSIFFESSFKQNPEISGLFEDPSSIKFSAMGIKVYSSEEKRTIVYPFLSAVSEKEQKGFTAMVLVPSPGVVVAPILNKIVDSDGKVGLGITQDIYNPEVNLKEPIIIFATGLTEAQIADMTVEELAKIDIFFIPAGVKIPYENISGGKANAIMAPLTPEAPSLPELLGGDPRFRQLIESLGKDRYKVEGNKVSVDWYGTGNFETAFEKVGDKWEVRKFILEREKPDIKVLSCVDRYNRSKQMSCIQPDNERLFDYYIKFFPGDLVLEPRRDFATGEITPGSILYTYAYTRRGPESPEEVIKIVLQVDWSGNGKNAAFYNGMSPFLSIFDLADKYSTASEMIYLFLKKTAPSSYTSGSEYFTQLNAQTALIRLYNDFFNGASIPLDTLFYSWGYTSGPIY